MMRLLVILLLAAAAQAGDGKGHWVIRVLDSEGDPVPRARIHLSEEGKNYWGSYDLGLEDGRHEHRSAQEGTRLQIEVTMPEDADGRPLPLGAARSGPHGPGEIVIRLAPEKVIRGSLRTEGGQPVPGATAVAHHADTNRCHAEGVSDPTGAFRLGRLGPFAYRLTVTPPEGFLRLESEPMKAGATDVVLVVSKLVEPRLVIQSPDKEPLPHCRVRLERPEVEDLVLTTDWRGAVVLPYLDPARALPLHIDPPDGGAALPHFDPEWLPKSQSFVLARAYSIAGEVRRADGTPVPGASIWVRDAPQGWSWIRLADGSQQGALADERGRFVVGRLPRSDVTLFAVLVLDQGKVVRGAPVRVDDDGKEVVLTLPAE